MIPVHRSGHIRAAASSSALQPLRGGAGFGGGECSTVPYKRGARETRPGSPASHTTPGS